MPTVTAPRPAATARPSASFNRPTPSRPSPSSQAAAPSRPSASFKPSTSKPAPAKTEHEILFQKFFKSAGPRTYASQIKRASNGNHYLVLTEGKRDDKTGEVKKIRLFIYSEDFSPFFRMLHETAQHIKANPVPPEVRQRREKFWARQNNENAAAPATNSAKR